MSRQIKWETSPGFFLYMALLAFVLPLPWSLAALSAGAVHEAGHLIALKALKIPVRSIRLEAAGARIQALFSSNRQELICAAAGPAAGLLVSLLFPIYPRLALCAMAQTAFNLLPLMPFDGGRVLRCAAVIAFGQGRGARIFHVLERTHCVAIVACGVLLMRFSFLLAAVCGLIVLRSVRKRNE